MKIYHDNKPRFKKNFRVFVTKLNNLTGLNIMQQCGEFALQLLDLQVHKITAET